MLEWAHGHERWASAPWGIQSLGWEGPYRGPPEPLRQTMGGVCRSMEGPWAGAPPSKLSRGMVILISVARPGLRRQVW